MEEPNIDPKFIFLVRDPRGILNRYVSDSYGWESKQRHRLSGISFLERRIYNNPHIPNINAISGALFTLRIQYEYTQIHCDEGARDGIDIWYMGIIINMYDLLNHMLHIICNKCV